MIRRAWRLVKEKHAASAFDGEGARLYGGRWNSPGISLVYTSATLSLAALESLVHLNPPVVFQYVALPVDFDDALMETIASARLPSDWTVEPPPFSAQAIGDQWVQAARSAVLEIPSAIVPTESNYLLNPTHPGFKKMTFGPPIPFAFDPRLL